LAEIDPAQGTDKMSIMFEAMFTLVQRLAEGNPRAVLHNSIVQWRAQAKGPELDKKSPLYDWWIQLEWQWTTNPERGKYSLPASYIWKDLLQI
jgi:hypothetical protein